MKKVISAGYQLTVTSWENDADCYMTKSIDGLNQDMVQFYVDMCKLLESRNSANRGFGNMYDPSETEIDKYYEALYNVYMKHKSNVIWPASWEIESVDETNVNEIGDMCHEMLLELFGYGAEGFYTRVLEKYEVLYFPIDIYADDVTEKF